MPKKLDNHYPQPCADCGHTNLHGEVGGCIANMADPGKRPEWCPCETYEPPVTPGRDRLTERAQGVALGQQGAAAALDGQAQGEWRPRADAEMARLIATREPFTSEHVSDAVGMPPSVNAMGGLFRRWGSSLELVGYETATRKSARGRNLRVVKGKAS